VRGSTPAPGPDFVRYGGHTSCVAVGRDGEAPRLVLDAGTGLQRLTRELDGQPFRGTILLGHLHWDHTHGLPFFAAGDNPDAEVTLGIPGQGDPTAAPVAALERFMSPPAFPITPRQLRGRWDFVALEPGQHSFEGFDVLIREIPHKGGRTLGFRISDGGRTVAYLSDHSPVVKGDGPDGFGAYHPDAMALAAGADVLVHDAQHTAAEFAVKRDWGHSAVDYAVGLGAEAGVGKVVLFHHDPPRTDDELDALLVEAQAMTSIEVIAASEGLSLPV
jgi:phosphoribosyl 1,2-cyclic phosphodiesterase